MLRPDTKPSGLLYEACIHEAMAGVDVRHPTFGTEDSLVLCIACNGNRGLMGRASASKPHTQSQGSAPMDMLPDSI